MHNLSVTPRVSAVAPTSAAPPAARQVGTVVWFNNDKGFGFAAPDGGGAEVFLHYSKIDRGSYVGGAKALADNARISYEILQGDKGPLANHITTIGPLLPVGKRGADLIDLEPGAPGGGE